MKNIALILFVSIPLACSFSACNFYSNQDQSFKAGQNTNQGMIMLEIELLTNNRSQLAFKTVNLESLNQSLELTSDENGKIKQKVPWNGREQEILISLVNPIGDHVFHRILVDKAGKYSLVLILDEFGSLVRA